MLIFFHLLFSGSYPSPKAGATLVMHKDLLVLFGGWTRPSPYPLHQPERFFDEIHTYSPSKNWWVSRLESRLQLSAVFLSDLVSVFSPRWNCIVTTHGPPPMAGHSSSVIGNTMVVFGGSLGARQMYGCRSSLPSIFLFIATVRSPQKNAAESCCSLTELLRRLLSAL